MSSSNQMDEFDKTRTNHAYLILAHHDFDVLKYLVSTLDDVRNDIYIHYDSKVSDLPKIAVKHAKLIILEDRVDVRWGDISVVKAEFQLFAQAHKNGHYTYYHLLSGVDMPLYSQDYIHSFFEKNAGKEFIGYSSGNLDLQLARKVQIHHLFARYFRDDKSVLSFFRKSIRFLYARIQLSFGLKRNKDITFKKGTQWVSLTHDFVSYMLAQQESVLKIYQNTFCADEIVVQTLCWNSSFRDAIYAVEDEASGSQRMIQWIDNQIYDWELKDLPKLLSSNLIFARKFNGQSSELLYRLSEHIKKVS